MYTWILSTGWWNGRAPINPDGVFVVGLLCACLIGGFIYIHRLRKMQSISYISEIYLVVDRLILLDNFVMQSKARKVS